MGRGSVLYCYVDNTQGRLRGGCKRIGLVKLSLQNISFSITSWRDEEDPPDSKKKKKKKKKKKERKRKT